MAASRPRTASLVLVTVALLAAAPAPPEPAADLVQRGNAAAGRGDIGVAAELYAAAAERTADPGLVAFNRAALLARQGRYGEAEALYARALDDRECPPARAARGWFDRGTCRLRAASTAAGFRAAVGHFERCLDLDPADEALKADARHNLELAKLLWAEANAKAAKPETPNEPLREDFPEPPQPPPGGQEPDRQTGDAADGQSGPNGKQAVRPGQGNDGRPEGSRPEAGNNPGLEVVQDAGAAEVRSAEDARERLRQADRRMRAERKALQRALAGPDRPGVRDW